MRAVQMVQVADQSSDIEIDTEKEIARIVVFCPGIHDFLDIDDCELVRSIDYSNLNTEKELICTF